METLTQICVTLVDPVLGPVLGISWTLTLAVVAAGTAAVLALTRRGLTDQDLLRRASEDKARIKVLIREARARGDREAVKRHKAVKSLIAVRTFGQEMKPLLAAVLPIAILATWCYRRLEFHPPRPGQAVEVAFYAPVSAVGETVHLRPQPGLESRDGWIRAVEAADFHGQKTGRATWRVTAAKGGETYTVEAVLRGKAYGHRLDVGRRTYSQPWKDFDGGQANLEFRLEPARLLGIVPGLGPVFPPWLVGYLLLVVPLAPVLKRVLRVY